MKHQSRIAIQYSGYPLSIADLQKQKPWEQQSIAVVKTPIDQTTSVEKNKITNDPNNWDENWFSNYE